MINRHQCIFALGILAAPCIALAQTSSPWLPIPGQASVGLSYTGQSGDSAYIGSTKLPIAGITGGGATKYKRSTTGVNVNYGLSESIAFDGSINYVDVKVGAADKDNGLGDTSIGVRYRLFDEFEGGGVPTVTFRLGALIKSGYDGARLAAIGKAANGFEFSALVGKQLTRDFSVQGELGVQSRSKSVPNATVFDIGARYRIGSGLSVNAGYNSKKYGGNLDIGGPGFSLDKFQQVREERSGFRFGAGYGIAPNQSLDLTFAQVSSGRNTVKDDRTIRLGYTAGF